MFRTHLIKGVLGGCLALVCLVSTSCKFSFSPVDSGVSSGLMFAGLKQNGVTLSGDEKSISLTWAPASGGTGQIYYVGYSDAKFTNIIFQTTTTSYVYQNPVLGQTYVFGVRARDDNGFDTNSNIVVLPIPDPGDHTPPDFNGLTSATVASDHKILLKWDPSPSPDISVYNVYNSYDLTQPVASTTQNYYLVQNLSPNTTYTYVVRAQDSSGNEEKNTIQKSATTLAYWVPDFNGLVQVQNLAGTDGLSKLKLTWEAASGNVTGYQIYMATSAGGEVYSDPIAAEGADTSNPTIGPYMNGGSTVSAIVDGLNIGETYYFVVRAFYIDSGGNDITEVNQLELSGTTLTEKAPTFAGILSASAADGSLGFSTVNVLWGTPTLDGVYDSFVVSYELGHCADGFSSSPSTLTVPVISQLNATISGLQSQQTYRFKVNSLYSPSNLLDTNTHCLEAFTSPPAPSFAGISSLTTATGIQGFTSLVVGWPLASGSFSSYLIELSLASDFSTIAASTSVSTQSTLSTTITGLQTNTKYYARVTAVYTYNTINLTSGTTKVMSAVTEPQSPLNEGITSVNVSSANSLTVVWAPPTNSGALYNGYEMWKSCGGNAPSDVLAKMTGTPDSTFPATQTQVSDTGLVTGTQCCYQVRAYYNDGTYVLASQSQQPLQCNTPELVPPTFNGIQTAVTPDTPSGFSTVDLTWTPVDPSQSGLFSYYQIAWATTATGQDWSSAIQIATQTVGSYLVTGLSPNTTYYFRVQAVNGNGSPSVASGANQVQAATTTPTIPNGDALNTAQSAGNTSIALGYTPPSSNPSVGGLYNNVFLFLAASSTANVDTFRTSLGTPVTGNINATVASGQVTVSSLPALVQIPMSEITSGRINNYAINGLAPNQLVCARAEAVYWVNGQPSTYLESTTPSYKCATPTAGPPVFSGVQSVTQFGDSRDFTEANVQWSAVIGSCTRIDISISTTPQSPDFTTSFPSYKNLSCSLTSQVVAGLNPHTTYYIQVQASNVVSGTTYASGVGQEISVTTTTAIPTGDGIASVTGNSVPKAWDTMSLTWNLASGGIWNYIYVWRGSGTTQASASASAQAAAATKSDNTGPTLTPFYSVFASNPASSTPTSYTDPQAVAGTYYCYLSRAVYYDGVNYQASANTITLCSRTAYTTPAFTGAASSGSSVVGTWPDGTAKIQLDFGTLPSGSIEEYWVYYSNSSNPAYFDFTDGPWQVVQYGDATYDPNPADNNIFVGGQGKTFSGNGYFVVRYKFYDGPDPDDTNTAVSNAVNILGPEANYVYVPPAASGLSYGYYIMSFEASVASGSFTSGDSITPSSSSLQSCNTDFHQNGISLATSCGTHASTAVVQSTKGSTPATANWHQAWFSCRGSSTSQIFMRLPTEDEWRRASKWASGSYATQWNTYTNGVSGGCNTTTGSVGLSGAGTSCVSGLGVHDMAGNVREWVDARMQSYSISSAGESRFSYGPTIGLEVGNGIDGLTRRFQQIIPGTSELALLLGSDFQTSGFTYRKSYDAETESWQDPTVSSSVTGFRCVAFFANQMPTMSQLAMPTEPTYTTADYSGSAQTWDIPASNFVKDTKPETVRINVTSGAPDGNVVITWTPWSKQVCSPTCSAADNTQFTYFIYRYVEPVYEDVRPNIPWALVGGSYSSNLPLDPIAVDSNNARLYSAVGTISGSSCNTTTPSNCTFTDSSSGGTGFNPKLLYKYILVAKDGDGNYMPAKVQRFRSPYFAGDPSSGASQAFRLEQRFRRASVFLVDESYQASQTPAQVMVYVPLDQSGLDHDFYIQKYEAAQYFGATANDSPAGSSGYPLAAATNSNSWVSNSAQCQDVWQRTGSFDASCGTNSTNLVLESMSGTSPETYVNWGDMWRGCRNSTFVDGNGTTYSLYLPSSGEWFQAADWGDLNFDGTIDQSTGYPGNVGTAVSYIEYQASSPSGSCNTDTSGVSTSGSAARAACTSRYGASEMVGSVNEWAADRVYADIGLDNGMDGLWLNFSMLNYSSGISTYDLLHSTVALSQAGAKISSDGNYNDSGTNTKAPARGGDYASYGNPNGRFGVFFNYALSTQATDIGGRCAR